MKLNPIILLNKLQPLPAIIIALSLAVAIILYPQPVFQAAARGLDAWFNIVIPALLPFFIISQIFMGLGVVNFLGVLLELQNQLLAPK